MAAAPEPRVDALAGHASAPPVILRVGGLSADELRTLSGGPCADHLARVRQLEADLAAARAGLEQGLYEAVHDAPAEQRRLFLALKRDSFNGRPLGKHRGRPGWWEAVERLAGLEAVVDLEERLAACLRELEQAYASQREREVLRLSGLAGQPGFLRGIALGSTVLAENLPRLSTGAERARRERRLELALLRYASRAALKLSPFSSLTRVGLCRLDGPAGPSLLDLADSRGWQERSAVRLQRFLADQLFDLLVRCRPFRESLPVRLNSSHEVPSADRHRFVRPGRWEWDPDAEALSQHQPALVHVTLRGPATAWLVERLLGGEVRYRELFQELATEFPEEPGEDLRARLDRLLDVGVLCFAAPWSAADLHWEVPLLEHLEALAPEEGSRLGQLGGLLRRALALLASYGAAGEPAGLVVEIRKSVREVLQTAAALGGLDSRVVPLESRERCFYEDVFLAAADQAAEPIGRLARTQAEEILANLRPFARMSTLHSSRRELLWTLAALAADRWPGRTEVGFLELFEAALPTFQQYVRHEAGIRDGKDRSGAAFNPLGLEAIELVRRRRAELAGDLERCLRAEGEEWALDREAVDRLLDAAPAAWTRERDFCAFVQPADANAATWVLNLLAEGAGRMSSRYTAAMDERTRTLFAAHFVRQSAAGEGEASVELVDLYFPNGNTANVHVPHTRRVFELPGHSSGLPPERCLRLRDLRVRIPGRDRAPWLVDRADRRVLPVHLGPVLHRFLPSLLKFLALFGPGEIRRGLPRARQLRCEGDVKISGRHRIGNVVYRRKTWHAGPAALQAAAAARPAHAAMLAIDRWRTERGIPAHVFVLETFPGQPSKPQYVDFASCQFVELFRAVVQKARSELVIVEALPDPDDLPRAADGTRWAVELQLESSALAMCPMAPSLVEEPGE